MASPHDSAAPDSGAPNSGDAPAPGEAAANPSMLARGGAPDDGSAAEHAIDTALEGLHGLDDLPVADHVARFDTVHTALTEALGRTESHQPGSHGGS